MSRCASGSPAWDKLPLTDVIRTLRDVTGARVEPHRASMACRIVAGHGRGCRRRGACEDGVRAGSPIAVTNQTLSLTLLDAHQYAEAADAARRGLAIDSTLGGLYVNLMEAELLGGHTDATVKQRTARCAARSVLGVRSAAIWVFEKAGRQADANALLGEMSSDLPTGRVPALDMAHALPAFGEEDLALVWINRSRAFARDLSRRGCLAGEDAP